LGDTAIAAPLDSLGTAYMANKDRLLTLAAAIVGDRAAAEDVVHDVFVGVARDGGMLSPVRWSAAYLTVATRNKAISLLRTRKIHSAYASDAASRDTVGGDSPAEAVARTEEEEIILRQVGALPDELRRVLALRIWGELGFAEIAKAENVSKSTARMRYMEALQRLRVQLGGRDVGRYEAE
jgi:RNA polymerase sigma-70 factor, ECF subfamily